MYKCKMGKNTNENYPWSATPDIIQLLRRPPPIFIRKVEAAVDYLRISVLRWIKYNSSFQNKWKSNKGFYGIISNEIFKK